MSIYVGMTDTFMSGWGDAEGRTNRYVVECDTEIQAQQIEKAARARDEMKRIKRTCHQPKSTGGMLVTLAQFNDLGEIWTGIASLTCYQCDAETTWLAPDSRCGKCTQFTPEEIRGE